MAKQELNFLDEAIETSKKAFWYVLLFSMAANLLMIVLPIYTLQVLDRVVMSRSMETLFWMSVIAFFLFIAFGAFNLARSATLVKLGEWFDKKVGARLLSNSLATSALVAGKSGSQNLRDLNTLKTFLTGQGLIALFDAPWALIYLAVIFIIHPLPGFVTLAGGLILFFLAILNEKAVKSALNEANEMQVSAMNHVDIAARNAEAIEAMGMMNSVLKRWQEKNQKVVQQQAVASNRSGMITSIARSARMILQIFVIMVGTWLVLDNSLSIGAIIACSILAGRALAPFEAAISAWSSVEAARKAYERLKKAIDAVPERDQAMSLPAPMGNITADKLVYVVPGTQKPILKGVSFQLAAGEILGIIGPSAAGKSTLAKLLVGVWKPTSGVVRLDNADVYSWNRDEFGHHIGYLPQDVELFEGTVRDNIARMRDDATDDDVVTAAKITGVHDLVLHLPKGYETDIGPAGTNLSAGQRQRVGLARAFFGGPRFVVLDEPNSNLDDSGEAALVMAMRNAKALKMTTIVIAHRPTILNYVDKLMVLRDGMVADFGPAQEILQKYTRRVEAPPQQAQQLQQQPTAPQAAQPVQPKVVQKAPEQDEGEEQPKKAASKSKAKTRSKKKSTSTGKTKGKSTKKHGVA